MNATHHVGPVQASHWKTELQQRMSELFEWKNVASKQVKADEQRIAWLERKLGQVIVERD